VVTARAIRKDAHVFGAAGDYVGTVEKVEGSALRLADCPFSEGGDCTLPLSWVEHADGFVQLDHTRLEVMEELRVAPGTPALALAADAE
jgi:hypothetical protein